MVLSVIIVNYRVRHFLELCLHSVLRTLSGYDAEIIVVDNHSGDDSIEMLRPLFPGVRFIENRENVGFAKANNQALSVAAGDYILFLNPDTILPEEFARTCVDFMKTRPEAGGVGVRMIDGSGRFLPESRRGFPSPWVAFSRLSGLSALFPRSRFFSGYYLGHLPADRTHPAPVLSGACMLVRRKILDEIGGFDERFFMYAEDIDLSYRIGKAGYTNYYLAEATIVHFKGESTQKDIRYVRQFYKAMRQFRRKHYNKGLPAIWNLGMEAAIWLRVGIGGLVRTGNDHLRPGPEVSGIWITGDPHEADVVRKRLGSRVSPDQDAVHLLFCEGAGFSFRQCIAALETGGFARRGRRILFHAAGTSSAVGSPDRDGRGETLVF